MFFYTKNAKGGHAYADQDTKAWDRVKGEVSKAVVAKRVDTKLGAKATFAAEVHELVDDTIDISAPTYRCSWDGVAPYVTTLEGVFPEEGIPIMGWPQTDAPPEPAMEEKLL